MHDEDHALKALELPVRRQIYDAVDQNPGLHFREVQRRTGLATGSLQYHLDYLIKMHLIRLEKQGRFARYYSIRGKQLGDSTKSMALLRQESLRKIVIFLLQHGKTNNETLAAGINLSPSTTSWHVEKLAGEGVVGKERQGRKTLYYLLNPTQMSRLLVEHRESFLDELVENFAEMWKEI